MDGVGRVEVFEEGWRAVAVVVGVGVVVGEGIERGMGGAPPDGHGDPWV